MLKGVALKANVSSREMNTTSAKNKSKREVFT